MGQDGKRACQIDVFHHHALGDVQVDRGEVPDGPGPGGNHHVGHLLGARGRDGDDGDMGVEAQEEIGKLLDREDFLVPHFPPAQGGVAIEGSDDRESHLREVRVAEKGLPEVPGPDEDRGRRVAVAEEFLDPIALRYWIPSKAPTIAHNPLSVQIFFGSNVGTYIFNIPVCKKTVVAFTPPYSDNVITDIFQINGNICTKRPRRS